MGTRLERAFDRLSDFEAVQRGASFADLTDAVARLQESVGIDEDDRALIRERLERRSTASGTHGAVLMGVILGLMAADLAREAV